MQYNLLILILVLVLILILLTYVFFPLSYPLFTLYHVLFFSDSSGGRSAADRDLDLTCL